MSASIGPLSKEVFDACEGRRGCGVQLNFIEKSTLLALQIAIACRMLLMVEQAICGCRNIKRGRHLNPAQRNTQLDWELRAAVRGFVASICASRLVVADMSELVRVTSVLPLPNLAYWESLMRNEFEFGLAQSTRSAPEKGGWRVLNSFGRPAQEAEPHRFLTWIDLSSWNGHVRERTLRTLTGPAPNSFFLSLAVRRLNDWVPQVRAAAREAVPRLAQATDPEQVVDMLCAMLPTWTSWGRVDPSDKQVMMELVSMKAVASELKRRVTGSPCGPMTAVLSQALRTAALDGCLMQIAEEAVQPVVRAVAHRTLLAGKAVWVDGHSWRWIDIRYGRKRLDHMFAERPLQEVPAFLDVLNAAAADRSPIVRRIAAQALVREMGHLGEAVLPLVRRLAEDASPSVAERGEFILKRLTAQVG